MIRFYLDFASPYACLAFEALPVALQGCSYHVQYVPVVLGALFQAHGVHSPAQIAAKHAWIRRHTEWLAQQADAAAVAADAPQPAPFAWPAQHPFNNIALSRLALACSRDGTINRYTAETIFHHVWRAGGAPALDAQRLQTLEQTLQQQLRAAYPLGSQANKDRLRANTDEALADGVFGVPAFVIDGQMLWGLDALPMLRALVQKRSEGMHP